ncbi:MAG: ABC transporter ATP-binding protein [Candidatus Omnitrophica bacterium]|nr:ABC transporter ATP-binding protein [Candidatus Omnitrophota bacterium]
MKPIIEVENISKKYKIGAQKERYLSLRDEIVKWISPSARRARTAQEELWALKDINFSIQEGEAVGIIGRNGAGKSTLLKVLSKITPPSEGKIKMRGRVASLLEVGTGFHPELTGRENIFLNGAVLGMTRAEIKKKFDEIVSFAEIEKFLDTPVKRYSSGMYVRLAFAVAAHLEPEILLVDEVLAVGDIEFQKKCLGKMGEVTTGGRTVLLVSHNMTAISRLCRKAILLKNGNIIDFEDSVSIINKYFGSESNYLSFQEWPDILKSPGDSYVRLNSVRVVNKRKEILGKVNIDEDVNIEMEYSVLKKGIIIRPWFILWNDMGICIFATTDTNCELVESPRLSGRYVSYVKIPSNLLSEGVVTVTAGMAAFRDLNNHFIVNEAVVFQVVDSLNGNTARGKYGGSFPGVVRPKLPWFTINLK